MNYSTDFYFMEWYSRDNVILLIALRIQLMLQLYSQVCLM